MFYWERMLKVKLAVARKWEEVEYRRGMRVKDLLDMLKYHPASIALISLNGTAADENAELKDGDEIILVPTLGGGIHGR
ncbi:MAG: MoaD/ThiS family protein [Hadesarchaea archaeon]|nr:MoaD/ThiS family protein [Hadesarchaea archaeon]